MTEFKCAKISLVCANCNREYKKRADRVREVDYCSITCRKIANLDKRAQRAKQCKKCRKLFIPRIAQLRVGQGKYCSLKCSTKATQKFRNSPEAREKATKTYFLNGHDKIRRRGPDNPLWTGGPEAARKRRIESGKSKLALAVYRSRNKERVREWAQKRRGTIKISRLPYGTIPRLLSQQRNCCVYCKSKLGDSYHIDHIMPIALGGIHSAENIQLLCKKCNLTKSAKHPISFAQSKGFLL